MKRVAAIALLIAAQSLAYAQISKEDKELCSSISRTAGTAMMARQNGASMAKLMEEDLKGMQTLWEMMVEEAFQTPRFSTPSNRQRAEDDYANEWYLRCIRSNRKK